MQHWLMKLFHWLRCLYEYESFIDTMNMPVYFHVALLIGSPSKTMKESSNGEVCRITASFVTMCTSLVFIVFKLIKALLFKRGSGRFEVSINL